MAAQNYIRVRFNRNIHGRKAGAVERVKATDKGIPLNMQIRRRLRDNDGSVEILSEKKSEPKAEFSSSKSTSTKNSNKNKD